MATQDASAGVAVSHASIQSGLRLVELPPEILDLIDSGNSVPLHLKSAPAQTPLGKPIPGAHAVLCTADKTYELKQVQTSNTVLVVRPQQQFSGDDNLSAPGLEAFATCGSTLEVRPFESGPKTKTPVRWLRELLPVWSAPLNVQCAPRRTKYDIFNDVPYSEHEIEMAWERLTAFEDDGSALRPTEEALLDLWRELRQCIDVTEKVEVEQIFSVMRASEYPRALLEALINRLTTTPNEPGLVAFDREATVEWLAVKLLACTVPPGTPPRWEDLVPQEWLSDEPQKQFEQYVFQAGASSVADRPGSDIMPSGGKVEDKSATMRIGRNTNWHEKFKRQKT